jgi:hypothetical protein
MRVKVEKKEGRKERKKNIEIVQGANGSWEILQGANGTVAVSDWMFSPVWPEAILQVAALVMGAAAVQLQEKS